MKIENFEDLIWRQFLNEKILPHTLLQMLIWMLKKKQEKKIIEWNWYLVKRSRAGQTRLRKEIQYNQMTKRV